MRRLPSSDRPSPSDHKLQSYQSSQALWYLHCLSPQLTFWGFSQQQLGDEPTGGTDSLMGRWWKITWQIINVTLKNRFILVGENEPHSDKYSCSNTGSFWLTPRVSNKQWDRVGSKRLSLKSHSSSLFQLQRSVINTNSRAAFQQKRWVSQIIIAEIQQKASNAEVRCYCSMLITAIRKVPRHFLCLTTF